jgi:hypothetical protein
MPRRIPILILICAAAGAPAAQAQARAGDTLLRVSLSGAPDRAFTLAQLQALGTDSARGRFHSGPEHAFVGVSLGRVLAAAGRPVDSLRGADLTQVVLVEASDGFGVVFALAELDPSFGTDDRPPLLLVWAEDGAPVAPEYGPLRIVATGEHRPSRWIRQVTRVSVFSVARGAAKP